MNMAEIYELIEQRYGDIADISLHYMEVRGVGWLQLGPGACGGEASYCCRWGRQAM